jgi:hypothetical protein
MFFFKSLKTPKPKSIPFFCQLKKEPSKKKKLPFATPLIKNLQKEKKRIPKPKPNFTFLN